MQTCMSHFWGGELEALPGLSNAIVEFASKSVFIMTLYIMRIIIVSDFYELGSLSGCNKNNKMYL